MLLKPFLLDAWLDQYEHDIEFNLAASTGPTWMVNDVLALADEKTRQHFLSHKLVYRRPAGGDSLRQAIAEMQGVPFESVQIVTGASEALLALMWLAAEPGANVIIPLPGFTTYSALPESLGLETRFYHVRAENGFRIDLDEIKRLVDPNTKLILINNPHNPTGATVSDGEMEALHAFTAERGIQLVSDEVYHPIYHGTQTRSAARLPHATVIADLSKAFSIPGVRTGWMIEHDEQRRQQYWTSRLLLSVQYNPGRDSFRDRNTQTSNCAGQDPGGRHSKPDAARKLYGGASRRAGLDFAEGRHDGVPMAAQRRERPPILQGRGGEWNPARSRRLLRYAGAFSRGLCRRWR